MDYAEAVKIILPILGTLLMSLIGVIIWAIRLEGKVKMQTDKLYSCRNNCDHSRAELKRDYADDMKEIKSILNELYAMGHSTNLTLAKLQGKLEAMEK